MYCPPAPGLYVYWVGTKYQGDTWLLRYAASSSPTQGTWYLSIRRTHPRLAVPVLVLVPPLLGRALSSVLERQQSEKYTPLSKHTLPASSDLTQAQTLFFFLS